MVHLADRRPGILRDAIRENCTKSVGAACPEQRAPGRFEVQPTSLCVTKGLPDALQRQVAGMEGIGVSGLLVVLGSVWLRLTRGSAPSAERRASIAIELAEELPVNHAPAGNQSPPSAIVSAILPRSQHVDLVVLGGRS